MSVKLITITPDAEKTLGFIARVSSPNQDNPDVAKLLAYMIRNKHWSPFEHAHMTVEIETSRAIARQILRHRSFCFQEFSQRYSEVSDEYIEVQARAQDLKNRQSSHDTLSEDVKSDFENMQTVLWEIAHGGYKLALQHGISKESARALLPEGMTPSKMYMTGNIRGWVHYLQVRCDETTQLEHREIAEQIKAIFSEQLPTVAKALGWVT